MRVYLMDLQQRSSCPGPAMDIPSPSFPPPHKGAKLPTLKPHRKAADSMGVVFFAATFLLVVTIQFLAIYTTSTNPSHPPPSTAPPPPPPRPPLTFHPLRDPAVSPYRDPNRTWFMSTLTGRGGTGGMPEHFVFPSRHPHDRILCINPRERSYALAARGDAFPPGGVVLRGLTFVADSYYDYENPWHALNAISPFFSWMSQNGCRAPARFVLFRNGEVAKKIGGWIMSLMAAALSGGVVVDEMESYGVACFEKAVVFRRGLGRMSSERRHALFEMLRCRAWEFCNVTEGGGGGGGLGFGGVKVKAVAREGRRGFKNESGVRVVMERVCGRFPGCSFRLVHLHNTTFCDQVKFMRETDVLATTHGAQLTNMMFMPKGSSIMEMFPKGWLEGAGVGQFIYEWLASWSEMSYEGAWRDTQGIDCSEPPSQCFLTQKNQQVGLNETHLSEWAIKVIKKKVSQKAANSLELATPHTRTKICSCDKH